MGTNVVTRTEVSRMSSAHSGGKGRRRRLTYLAVALLVVAIVGFSGASWYFSAHLLDVAPYKPIYAAQVLALHPHTIRLTRTDESATSEVDGLIWPGGRAVVGKVISSNGTSVLREISGNTRGLRVGTEIAFDNHVYTSPAAFHIGYRTVDVPDPLGPMPAWYVPGSRATWAIVVHGYTTDRTEGLRALPTLVRLGFPTLFISYRNDVGSPESPDHLYHLGATEWQDVQAAVRYALGHGAHSVVLYGFSMGGNAVESFLHHSTYAPRVRAVVLDAPVLDWKVALNKAAAKRNVPGPLTAITERLIAYRIGLSSLDSIDQVKAAADLKAPTLVFHGTADATMPIGPSIALARARPDIVTLVQVRGADHTASWNVAPKLYTARLRAFLRRVTR